MKNHAIKLIIAVMLISCLMVGFCTTSHAIVGEVVGGAALLGSALGSVGVDLAVSAGVGYIGYELLNQWINSGYSIKGAITGVADGYVKVKDDSVIIDGVEYQSIYLSPEMASQLHTQVFDFITQNAITDNSSGILAEGVGLYNNTVQLFDVNGVIQSQIYTFGESGGTNGGWSLTTTVGSKQYYGSWYDESNSQYLGVQGNTNLGTPVYTLAKVSNNSLKLNELNSSGIIKRTINTLNQNAWTQTTFEYDYVAGVIDADPLPADYGFEFKIPSSILQQAGIQAGTIVIDGGTGTDAIYELIDLIDSINPENIKEAEFAEEDVPPVPPTPIPTTALGDVPYNEFIDTFGQSVTDGLENVNDTIGLYGEEIIDTVDTVGQSITDELQNVGDVVDTVGQSIVDELENVETGIDTLGQTITGALDDAIDNVLEAVDSIATNLEDVIEAIMTHPLDLFSNFLDRLANIPIIKNTFNSFKEHVGIWHYVVEWLTCVGGFLGFMIGVFSDTAYCMVVPIYACVAASICLAFYKRFGR